MIGQVYAHIIHWISCTESCSTFHKHIYVRMYIRTYVCVNSYIYDIYCWHVLLCWCRLLHCLQRRGLCDLGRGTGSGLCHCSPLQWSRGGVTAGTFEGAHFEANGKAIDVSTMQGDHKLRQSYTAHMYTQTVNIPYNISQNILRSKKN